MLYYEKYWQQTWQEVNLSIVQSNLVTNQKNSSSQLKKKKAKNKDTATKKQIQIANKMKNTASQIKELQIKTTRGIAFSSLELTKF